MPIRTKISTFARTLSELFKKETRLLAYGFLILTSFLIFLAVAEQVHAGNSQQFDEAVLKLLRNSENTDIPRGPAWMLESVRDITALGGGTVIILVSFAVVGFLVLKKEYRIMWFIIFATVGGALLEGGFKMMFTRQRPSVVLHLMEVTSYSFPSGHSAISAVVYLSYAALLARIQDSMRMRIFLISLAVLLVFIIGLSRMYLGVHYPTDVLAGWSMGLGWASFCWFLERFLEIKSFRKKAEKIELKEELKEK